MSRMLVRVDADAVMGWGHLLRCLALADAWCDAGGTASFVTRRDPASPAVLGKIRARGHRCFAVDPGLNPKDELRYLLSAADAVQPEWLVLDGYHFSEEYQQALHRAGPALLVFDDLGLLPEYHCDLLVNSGPQGPAIDYRCAAGARLLLGPEYVPVRREVLHVRRPIRGGDLSTRRLLVTLGGGEWTEPLRTLIDGLAIAQVPGLEAQILVGASPRQREPLERQLALHPHGAITLATATDDLPQRMVECDAAISAGGGTLWELAYLGVPAIVITLADNQRPIAAWAAEQGAAEWLGDADQLSAEHAAAAIERLFSEPQRLRAMSAAGRKLIDGRGAARIVRAMRQAHFTLRGASEADLQLLWRWANEPDIREVSFSSQPISWATHTSWFAAELDSQDSLLLMAIDSGGEPLGQVRFRRQSPRAVASITIARQFRRQGFGVRLIRRAARIALDRWPDVDCLEAEIKTANDASRRAFAAAGFCDSHEVERSGATAIVMRWERKAGR